MHSVHLEKTAGVIKSCRRSPKEKYSGLPNHILNTIKPVYLQFYSLELLSKCFHGKTQNPNEYLNGIIWQRVPKDIFAGLKILKICVYYVIIQLNDGYKSCLKVKKILNISDPGYFTLKGYDHLDQTKTADKSVIPL